ncbi:hypothetical protein WMY93_022296 [Mugilogobius chulae]|uniref:Uncharacterized protein n=1 Tax=Mugilogobius chulae TaxID=88201 RepID=A0AAW0NAX2_9GOBI
MTSVKTAVKTAVTRCVAVSTTRQRHRSPPSSSLCSIGERRRSQSVQWTAQIIHCSQSDFLLAQVKEVELLSVGKHNRRGAGEELLLVHLLLCGKETTGNPKTYPLRLVQD